MKLLIVPALCLATLGNVDATSDEALVIAHLKKTLPPDWAVSGVIQSDVPPWSLSGAAVTKLIFGGPAKTGYRYYDKEGRLITEHFSAREAIVVWITDAAFDPGWPLSKKLKNRISKIPIARPELIYDGILRVFASEDIFSIDATYTKESPIGTARTKSIPFTRSWPGWEAALRGDLEELQWPVQSIQPTPESVTPRTKE